MNDAIDMPENAVRPESDRRTEGPGRLLKSTREARGLSQEDVASQLRLHRKLIAALEEEDDGALPPATFVFGYLRNYARLLDLSPDEVVRAYEGKGIAPPALESVRKATPVHPGGLQRIFSYVLVLGLAVLLVMWWQSQRPELSISPEPPQPSVSVPEDVEANEPPVGLVPVGPDTPLPGVTLALEEVAPATVPSGPGAEVVREEAPAEPPAAAAPAPESALVVETVGPDTARSRLVLRFKSDCWTEISDAAGRRVFFDLGKVGREIVAHGEAPFRVFLGYAPGVEIEFNGEPYDHSRFHRRELARFQLGAATDNAVRRQ